MKLVKIDYPMTWLGTIAGYHWYITVQIPLMQGSAILLHLVLLVIVKRQQQCHDNSTSKSVRSQWFGM